MTINANLATNSAILQAIARLLHAFRKKSIFKIKVILQFWLVHHTAIIGGVNAERFNDFLRDA